MPKTDKHFKYCPKCKSQNIHMGFNEKYFVFCRDCFYWDDKSYSSYELSIEHWNKMER